MPCSPTWASNLVGPPDSSCLLPSFTPRIPRDGAVPCVRVLPGLALFQEGRRLLGPPSEPASSDGANDPVAMEDSLCAAPRPQVLTLWTPRVLFFPEGLSPGSAARLTG